MSYLSTTENVGFNGIPQNISDASCATQYKMAVEGVSGSCGDVNVFIHDSSGDEQPYITHDNFFHTKFKIDPNELYTFHDSDVIANEITVSHTEDNFIFTGNGDVKTKLADCPSNETDFIGSDKNGDVAYEVKKEVICNGHYPLKTKLLSAPNCRNITNIPAKLVESKNAKIPKANQIHPNQINITSVIQIRRPSVHCPNVQVNGSSPSCSNSITSVNDSISSNNGKTATVSKSAGMETFLDVFKREQGLFDNVPEVKIETPDAPVPVAKPLAPKPKKASSGKTPTQPKVKRGRGPAVHEALQRIPSRRATPVANRAWHAPGDDLFQCGPLLNQTTIPFSLLETSGSEDDMPDIDVSIGPVCVEENVAESRGARLAFRRAALRRRVVHADLTLRHLPSLRPYAALTSLIKKQLKGQGPACRLPAHTVNQLLAMRGMTSLLSPQERRQLRETGWSGGESGSTAPLGATCAEDRCNHPPLPCAPYCLSHVTQAPEQRLYAACAAVFAGGTRCMQPLLPLQDQTPLCAEHARKRDNYDKLSRDGRPKKPPLAPPPLLVRMRVCPPPLRPLRRPKRRRRPPLPLVRTRPSPQQSLSEINVCSNSSAYDSSEDTVMGALSENEYIVTGSNDIEVDGQVPPDDILDPSVLSQIPDEAFTAFFNQAEGAPPFAESSELAAALEAVLDDRVLDTRGLDTMGDCEFTRTFTPPQVGQKKIQGVAASVNLRPNAPS